jgi:transcriptional regulator with XRE-family HTH domain
MSTAMMVNSDLVGQVFGASVRHVRKSLGMKQEVLAEAVGYSRTRLSEIENGDLPTFDKAVSIANELRVPLDRLLYPLLSTPAMGTTPHFLHRLMQLPSHEQRRIVELFQVLLDEIKLVVVSA